jgi:hypothetical protein
LDGKVAICGSKGSNECIFERLDGLFSRVDTMIMGLNELEFAFVLVKKLLDVFGGLVVHDIELRLEPLLGEIINFLYASKIVVSSNALIGSARMQFNL